MDVGSWFLWVFIYLTPLEFLQPTPCVPLPWKGRGNYLEERLRLSMTLLSYLSARGEGEGYPVNLTAIL